MPFRSEKQRRFMFAKHPDIAEKWAHEYGIAPRQAPSPPKTVKRNPRKGK